MSDGGEWVGSVASGCLVWVEPVWRGPVRDAVDHLAGPAEFGVFAVVEAAEQGAVVDAGCSGEGVVGDVVALAAARCVGASGEGAAEVAGGHGEALALGEDAAAAGAVAEDLALLAEDDGEDPDVAD